MGLLRQRTHKELASRICHSVLDAGTRITSPDKVAMLFRSVKSLMEVVFDEHRTTLSLCIQSSNLGKGPVQVTHQGRSAVPSVVGAVACVF
jgi:hypothetical protein